MLELENGDVLGPFSHQNRTDEVPFEKIATIKTFSILKDCESIQEWDIDRVEQSPAWSNDAWLLQSHSDKLPG